MPLKLSDLDSSKVRFLRQDEDTSPTKLKLSELDPRKVKLLNEMPDTGTESTDTALMAIRSAIEGHTGGISEPLVSGLKASGRVPMPYQVADDPYLLGQFQDAYLADVAQRRADKEANPGIDLSSQIAGALVPSPANVPGKILKGAKAVGSGLKGTELIQKYPLLGKIAESVLGGFGLETTRQAAQRPTGFLDEGSATDDIATSTAISAGLPIAGKALKTSKNIAKSTVKKALTTLGPTEEAINARLAGKAQDSAKSYAELAEDMTGALQKLSDIIKKEDDKAWAKLSRKPSISKHDLTEVIDRIMRGMMIQGETVGPADNKAIKVLASIRNDLINLGQSTADRKTKAEVIRTVQSIIDQMPSDITEDEVRDILKQIRAQYGKVQRGFLEDGKISEWDLKSIIQNLDDNIHWDDQNANRLNTLLENVRVGLDNILKKNKNYERDMVPVAEKTGLIKDMQRLFNFRKSPKDGLVPTDATASKIQTSLRENKAVTDKVLQDLKKIVGKDFSALAKDYQLAKQFQVVGGERSSARTNAGAVLGATVGTFLTGPFGGLLGGSAGVVTGKALDRYGGKLTAAIIDKYVKSGNFWAFGKYGPIIEKAAENGPEALQNAIIILSREPDFRRTVKKLEPKRKKSNHSAKSKTAIRLKALQED